MRTGNIAVQPTSAARCTRVGRTLEGAVMRRPYRIIVWGPGHLGSICIWETLQSPAFELVGVRTYSAAKDGVDVGDLLGIGAIGIGATTDVETLLRVDCDCIVYTPHDQGTFHTDEELLRLLTAGKNVVTPLPYHNARLVRDADFVEALDAACQTGGCVFHAGGIDPDLVSDRILLALTGACTEITSIKLQEIWDCSFAAEGPLKYLGFGLAPDVGAGNTTTQAIPNNFLTIIVRTAERVLGVTYDRVETTHEYVTTPADIHEPFLIPAGTVGRVVHRSEAFVDDITEPFFTMELNWLIGNSMLPEGVSPGQYYVATIEGRPSITMAIGLRVSHHNDDRIYRIGSMAVEPSYVATVSGLMQAIPHICEAKPGVLPSFGPTLHWMKDLRDSVVHPAS
jgi:2,4-diaminopentanoate dehydrogenase